MPPTTRFPAPLYGEGRRRRWSETDLLNYERGLRGLPPVERPPEQDRWLSSADVKRRLGVSSMWLHRRASEHDRNPTKTDAA